MFNIPQKKIYIFLNNSKYYVDYVFETPCVIVGYNCLGRHKTFSNNSNEIKWGYCYKKIEPPIIGKNIFH